MSFTHTMKSRLTGNVSNRVIPMNYVEFQAAHARWKAGALIQDAFPTLSADDREFIMTGITPEEWAEIFGEEE